MYKRCLVLILCAICCVKCDEENCDKIGVNLYEDLGCKPVTNADKKCPIKYDCPPFEPKNNTCTFRNRQYNIGEQVDNELIYGTCNVGCYCTDKSDFRCAVLDCPEWLGVRPPLGCGPKYELDKCCSTGHICPPFHMCEVSETKYSEGQRFNPPNTCLQCICNKGFKGKFEAPFCKKQTCAVQIRDSDKLEAYCAPAYTDQDILCCPSTWLCPMTTDVIVQQTKIEPNPDVKCKFGSKLLNLGEGFERTIELYDETRKMKCECILPPLLTCKQ